MPKAFLWDKILVIAIIQTFFLRTLKGFNVRWFQSCSFQVDIDTRWVRIKCALRVY